jgi:hypothetical protein
MKWAMVANKSEKRYVNATKRIMDALDYALIDARVFYSLLPLASMPSA